MLIELDWNELILIELDWNGSMGLNKIEMDWC